MIVEKDFRSQIFSRSTESIGKGIGSQIRLAQTKVTQRNMSRGVEEDIFWFQIAVSDIPVSQRGAEEDETMGDSPIDNVVNVQVLQCENNLGRIKPSSVFCKPPLLL